MSAPVTEPTLSVATIAEAVGAVLSTVNALLVTCVAALPALSDTSAVIVYEEPSVNACKPAAVTVMSTVLEVTIPV